MSARANPRAVSPATRAKARRLVDTGAIGNSVDVLGYPAHGDHGEYWAFFATDGRPLACTCPTVGLCSHLLAVAEKRAEGTS